MGGGLKKWGCLGLIGAVFLCGLIGMLAPKTPRSTPTSTAASSNGGQVADGPSIVAGAPPADESSQTASNEHVEAAQDYFDAENLGLALTEVQQAIAIWPGNPDAADLRGKVAAAATATVEAVRAQEAAAAQAAAAQAASARATAEAVPHFGDGQKIVGAEITPGTYRTRTASSGCYWARLSGFGGSTREIIANQNTNFPEVVTILADDAGFTSRRCGTWTQDLSSITASPTAPFKEGTYIVGADIAPGTWRTEGGDGCYWARLSAFGGPTRAIIANDNARGSAVVTIAAGDKGFTNQRCGTWVKIG